MIEMEVVRFGAIAAAITACVVALRTIWHLFVQAVKTAVSDEMSKFHNELNSYDEFWTERLKNIEAMVDELKAQVDELAKRIK